MTRPSAMAAVAGALGAALLIAFFRQSILGVSVGMLLSPLPLAMAALGLGLVYLPVAVVGGAVTVTVLTGSFAFAVVYLLVDAVPVAALSRLGFGASGTPARGVAMGRTLCLLSLGAALFMGLALALLPANPDGIEAAVRALLDQILNAVPAPKGATATEFAAARDEFARAAASFLPGGATWELALRALLSTALAQYLLQRMDLAKAAAPAYRSFEVPGWFFYLLAGIAAVGLTAGGDVGFVANNTALALCLPPLLQGLAVVHSGLGRLPQATIWLVVFYTVALLVPFVALLALVSLAVGDHFLQIRTRYLIAGIGGK